MINLTFDVLTGVARLVASAIIVSGSDVPVTVTFSSAVSEDTVIQLALGPDAPIPSTLAFTEAFTAESTTVWKALLNANDTRLVAFLVNKGPTAVNLELVCEIEDVRRVAPHLQVTVQPRIISGPDTTEDGPVYLTEAEVMAAIAAAFAGGVSGQAYDIPFAASDETTVLTNGAEKVTLRAPRAMTVTDVRASLTTPGTGDVDVDVQVNGVSILAGNLRVALGDTSSEDYGFNPAVENAAIAEDDEITVEVVAHGNTATGLKIYIIGHL